MTVIVPDQFDYAHWGGHNEILEAWWRDVCVEASGSPRLAEAEALIEAATKIDLGEWMNTYVAYAFYTAYRRQESQWRLYARLREVKDFKEFRLKGKNPLTGFGYIGDHNHAPGMRRSFRPEASLFLDTYGAEHEATRHALINGDAEEIMRDDPDDMGAAASNYLARAVVALMESNPTAPDGAAFFSTLRGNLTTNEISAASLIAAYTAFQTRLNPATNEPFGVDPRRLIVQNRTIAAIALREITSQQAAGVINDPANGAFPRGTDNAVARHIAWPTDFVVEETRLTDFNNGFMIADPDQYEAFAVGMLRGNTEPQLWRSADGMVPIRGSSPSPYQFRVLKIMWQVLWDIGVAAVNPDVAYKFNPA